MATANGMNFRVNLGTIGRPATDDTAAGEGLNYFERQSLKNQAINQLSDAAAQQARAENYAQDSAWRARQQQLIDDAQRSYDQSRLDQAFAPPIPPTSIEASPDGSKVSMRSAPTAPLTPAQVAARRQRALDLMPSALRPIYEQQYAAMDLAEQKERAAEASNPLLGSGFVVKDANGQPLQGVAVLKQLAPAVRNQVVGILEGRQAMPAGTATKDPYWKSIIQIAQQVDPNFDAVNFNARANTRKDFTSGKSAQQINAINTVIGHLSDLAGEGEKLGNYGTDWVNALRNKLTRGGTERGVALNNFETLKEGVGNELMRVWRQVGAGSEKEIEDWKATIGAAKSPEELRGAFKTIGGMLESKLSALDEQYKQGMGTDKVSAISEQSRQRLDRLTGGGSDSGGAVEEWMRDANGKLVKKGKG